MKIFKIKTIKEPINFSGKGLHTGEESKVSLHPNKGENIKITLKTPSATKSFFLSPGFANGENRCTSLHFENEKIWTMEHLLSSLCGLGFIRCDITVEGIEIPSFDNSSKEFVEKIEKTGYSTVFEENILYLKEPVYKNFGSGKEITALPSDTLIVTYIFEYNKEFKKSISIEITKENYVNEISKAKTFVFYNEIEEIRKIGLGKAGNIENVIVFKDNKCINPEILTYEEKEEAVKHKILDLLGDLYLIGKPFQSHIIAKNTGHKQNIEFVKILKDYLIEGEEIDINKILTLLPHKYPFLLVDRIISLEKERVIGIKNVTINEPFFQGHFPKNPVMPGVLILEAMAQTGGIIVSKKLPSIENKLFYFAGIDNVKFRRPVIPGDTLYFVVELVRFGGKTIKMKGKAFVGQELCAEADLSAILVEKQS